ncbi:gas vesicle protein GvpH [Natronobiforma cellulositropha]|uniref:gas vesicle protein GvpH n=1 Tax=Natronobiforma cellulositropha TaxID=1679076 RepID=UPI0021D5EE24|nr:gas vesicle protein GvpH [Natronobiforma cellulositropha]
MTEPPDGSDSADRRADDGDPPSRPAPDAWLSSLVDALERFGEWSRESERRPDAVFEYDLRVRSVLDASDARRGPPSLERPRPGRGRPQRRQESARPPVYTTTRTRADELEVSADLTGVDPDSVVVGFDGPDLVVAVDGHERERISTPWEALTADARVRNGILTVRVRPTDDETAHGGETRD